MKRNELNELKKEEEAKLANRLEKARKELGDLVVDKYTKKLKDLKAYEKKRKEIAQIMTIIRQKRLLKELETTFEKNELKKKGRDKI